MGLAKRRNPVKRRPPANSSIVAGVEVDQSSKVTLGVVTIDNVEAQKAFCLVYDSGCAFETVTGASFDQFKAILRSQRIDDAWLPLLCSNLLYVSALDAIKRTSQWHGKVKVGTVTFGSIDDAIAAIRSGITAIVHLFCWEHKDERLEANIDLADAKLATSRFTAMIDFIDQDT